jgi:hypothetical protein
MDMKINEVLSSKQKHFAGTCVNSFGADGECVVPQLPWSDASGFAVDEENAITIPEHEFSKIAVVPDDVKRLILGHHLLYQRSQDAVVYWIYDNDADVHYFFA